MVVYYPKFPVEDNGEIDHHMYEVRFKVLCDLVQRLIGPDECIFFFDTSVTFEELQKALCYNESPAKTIVLSSVYDESRWTLKSTLHPVEGLSVPSWYPSGLANQLKKFSTDGVTVFDKDSLEAAVERLGNKYGSIRIKNGAGCSGRDQMVVKKGLSGDLYSYNGLPWKDALTDRILRDISDVGIVIEKNLPNGPSYSFTSFILPFGAFTSVGIILDRVNHKGENVYCGTTCLVTSDDKDFSFDIQDPIFGRLCVSEELYRQIRASGEHIADIYRRYMSDAVLPRINMDFMLDEQGVPRLLDVSLRVGGNSWSEYKGAERLIQEGCQSCIQSIRIVELEQRSAYKANNCEIHDIYWGLDTDDENVAMFGIDHY